MPPPASLPAPRSPLPLTDPMESQPPAAPRPEPADAPIRQIQGDDRSRQAATPLELTGRLRGLNIYLVGMMGAGKSAVGRPLAEALGYGFLDADTALEQVAGQSIASLFAEAGEEGFRELETAVLGQIAGFHSQVVATGGGVVGRSVNWGHLQQGVVVWLDAPLAVLLERLQADPTPRPLLQGPDPAGRLASLIAEREPLYAQADLRIPQTGDTPAGVARKVLEALPTILRSPDTTPAVPELQLLDRDGNPLDSINQH